MDEREKKIRDFAKREWNIQREFIQPYYEYRAIVTLLSIIDSLRAERDELKKKYTQTVAQWQVRAERAEAGEAEEIDKRMKIAWQLDEIREAWEPFALAIRTCMGEDGPYLSFINSILEKGTWEEYQESLRKLAELIGKEKS